MYVHIIDNQSDDIINKQQYMQNTGNCCVKVNIGHILGPVWCQASWSMLWALLLLSTNHNLDKQQPFEKEKWRYL